MNESDDRFIYLVKNDKSLLDSIDLLFAHVEALTQTLEETCPDFHHRYKRLLIDKLKELYPDAYREALNRS